MAEQLTLYVIRHAKSSWEDASLHDTERPLKKRGKKDAKLMGRLLAERGVQFDAVLSSPAERAHRTCKIFCKAVGFDGQVVKDKRLYFKGTEAIAECIRELVPKSAKTVAVFGHNPDFTDFLNGMHIENKVDNLPTAGVGVVEVDAKNWMTFEPSKCVVKLVDFASKHKQKE